MAGVPLNGQELKARTGGLLAQVHTALVTLRSIDIDALQLRTDAALASEANLSSEDVADLRAAMQIVEVFFAVAAGQATDAVKGQIAANVDFRPILAKFWGQGI